MAESRTNTDSQTLDVTAQQIARVYAQAFLGASTTAAGGDVAAPAVHDDVQQLRSVVSEVLDRFPKFESTLRSALVPADAKERMLDNIFRGKSTQVVLSLLKVLARHNRLEVLRLVATQVERLHNERQGRREVEVRVARELTPELTAELTSKLKQQPGLEPVLETTVDPSLIAGMVVKVGDKVYDGSVATQLAKARQEIIAHVVEVIQTQPERLASQA